jgi:hypothetical protein
VTPAWHPAPVRWPDEIQDVIAGDLTVAAAYVTAAGGAVLNPVAPCGLHDRDAGRVAFTTSLGLPRKLEHIIRNPKVALAYHTREHSSTANPRFVLAQGTAAVDLTPAPARLQELMPVAERFLGPGRHGPVWDRLLREYYTERVFVDVDVARVTVWPDLAAAGTPSVVGEPAPDGPPPSQAPPKNGTGPRVDVAKAARALATLPHRLVGWRGADGFPVVAPVKLAGHDAGGLRLVAAPGVLPPGQRRAGLLAHAFRPQLVGLGIRLCTGWLEVADDGTARYAPHTSKTLLAPPNKRLLLVSNGLVAKYGMRQAKRKGVLQHLQQLQQLQASPPTS